MDELAVQTPLSASMVPNIHMPQLFIYKIVENYCIPPTMKYEIVNPHYVLSTKDYMNYHVAFDIQNGVSIQIIDGYFIIIQLVYTMYNVRHSYDKPSSIQYDTGGLNSICNYVIGNVVTNIRIGEYIYYYAKSKSMLPSYYYNNISWQRIFYIEGYPRTLSIRPDCCDEIDG